MITGKDFYEILSALVPLYVTMILAYSSVRWWKIFTPDQCSGISRFVSSFAVPFLSFHFIYRNDPYTMNFRFIGADTLQKLLVLCLLFLWQQLFTKKMGTNFANLSSVDWSITLFSLSTLPNTLVMGVPLLAAMYGDFTTSLMTQVVVMQSIIWYTVLIFLFEYRGAKILLSDRFSPRDVESIASFKVDSDVVSLTGMDPLRVATSVREDGKLHVVISGSGYCCSSSRSDTEMEIYSIPSSSREGGNLKKRDFFPAESSRKITRLRSEYVPEELIGKDTSTFERVYSTSSLPAYLVPNMDLSTTTTTTEKNETSTKKLHMFVWNTNSSSIPEANMLTDDRTSQEQSTYNGLQGSRRHDDNQVQTTDKPNQKKPTPLAKLPLLEVDEAIDRNASSGSTINHPMPSAIVMTRLILIIVGRKLMRNPNTYASILGLVWSLISFRWNIKLPKIIDGSISILSNTGLGMAMFSLGLFMGSQPKILACGKKMTLISSAVRFLVGPIIMAVTSIIVGIRGNLLRVSILQASLPQGIVPFVFAKEYNCHPDILSTGVVFGMVIALPITIIYYIILGVV